MTAPRAGETFHLDLEGTAIGGGVPHAARHCHVLRFDSDGLIVEDRFFCGGRWDAALLAEMAADQ